MAIRDWLDMSHGATSANDGDSLTLVFDGVKQLGEVPRSIGSTDFCHQIRLSDSSCRRTDTTEMQPCTGDFRPEFGPMIYTPGGG